MYRYDNLEMSWGRGRKKEWVRKVSGCREVPRKYQPGLWGVLKPKVFLKESSVGRNVPALTCVSLWLGAAQKKCGMDTVCVRRAAAGAVSQLVSPKQQMWVGPLHGCHMGGGIRLFLLSHRFWVGLKYLPSCFFWDPAPTPNKEINWILEVQKWQIPTTKRTLWKVL